MTTNKKSAKAAGTQGKTTLANNSDEDLSSSANTSQISAAQLAAPTATRRRARAAKCFLGARPRRPHATPQPPARRPAAAARMAREANRAAPT